MSQAFTPFIKAIGAGQRAGRCLTEQEAFSAMSMLLNGQVLPEQKGAFLMLLRVREESVDELTGFVKACRTFLSQHSRLPSTDNKKDIDIACYAGKRRQLPWFILALSIMHQNGYRIFMHGTAEPLSQRLYVKDVFRQLGILPSLQASSVQQALQSLDNKGAAYMDLRDFHAPLDDIIKLRELFGLRSCANTLARLLNPLNAPYSVQGVHHQGVDEKHIKIAANLADKHVLCFRGEGGEPEVNPSKVTICHFYAHNSQPSSYQVEVPEGQSWQIKPKILDASLLLDCWQGKYHSAYAELTVIKTLVALIIMTQGCSVEEAGQLANTWWHERNTGEFMSVNLAARDIHNEVATHA